MQKIIQMVIKLPEQDYELACKYPEVLFGSYAKAIKNGIVLPEQARIIDMDKLAIAPIDITDLPHDKCLMVYYPEDLDDATILEGTVKE